MSAPLRPAQRGGQSAGTGRACGWRSRSPVACRSGASAPATTPMLVAVAGGGRPELSSGGGDLVAHRVARRCVSGRGREKRDQPPLHFVFLARGSNMSCPTAGDMAVPPFAREERRTGRRKRWRGRPAILARMRAAATHGPLPWSVPTSGPRRPETLGSRH